MTVLRFTGGVGAALGSGWSDGGGALRSLELELARAIAEARQGDGRQAELPLPRPVREGDS